MNSMKWRELRSFISHAVLVVILWSFMSADNLLKIWKFSKLHIFATMSRDKLQNASLAALRRASRSVVFVKSSIRAFSSSSFPETYKYVTIENSFRIFICCRTISISKWDVLHTWRTDKGFNCCISNTMWEKCPTWQPEISYEFQPLKYRVQI